MPRNNFKDAPDLAHIAPISGMIEVITPDDDEDVDFVTRALNVAESGVVRVTTVGGSTNTVYIAAGIAFPIRVVRVWATDTTATGIRGLS